MKKWLIVALLACSLPIISGAAIVKGTEVNTVATLEFEEVHESLSAAILDSKNKLMLIEEGLTEIEERNRKEEAELAVAKKAQVVSRGASRSKLLSLNLNTPFGLTAEEYDIMLVGTPLYGHGWIFEKAEKEEGVNGLFLYGITGQEQSFGAANTGLKKKNNLTSWNAPDSSPGSATTFDSYYDCIQTTAKALKANYLTKGGKYYNGATISGVNVRYASDQNWDTAIADLMQKGLNKLKK